MVKFKKFKKGDIVHFIRRSNNSALVSPGNSYVILGVTPGGFITIINNLGKKEKYFHVGFELDTKAIRDNIINEILE